MADNWTRQYVSMRYNSIMNNTNCGIYRIDNVVNGKFYIGSSVSFKNRWNSHISALRRDDHPNSHLQRAFNKYSEENFKFSIVEVTTLENIVEREQHWLDTTDACNLGYNKSAYAHMQLHKLTPEHIDKLRQAGIGRVHTEATKEKMRQSHLGRKFTEEHCKNMSESRKGQQTWLGRKHSEETKAGMNKNRIGKPLPEETLKKISESLKASNRKMPDHVREALKAANTGRKHTPEAIEKIRDTAKNRTHHPRWGTPLRKEEHGF